MSRFNECLAKRRKLLGDNHSSTLHTERGIAVVLLGMGKYEESRKRSESILERLGTRPDQDDTLRGRVLVNLGKCFTALGKYPEAERTLREAQALFLKKVGPRHKDSRTAAAALQELLERKARTRTEGSKPRENLIQ